MSKVQMLSKDVLEEFLSGRTPAPRTEAGYIWRVFVRNSAYIPGRPLPLYIRCRECDKEYGDCPDGQTNYRGIYHDSRIDYWLISSATLHKSRNLISNSKLQNVGPLRRVSMLAWIDQL